MMEEIDPNKRIIKVLIAIVVVLVIVLIMTIISENKKQKILEDSIATQSQENSSYQLNNEEKIKESSNEIQVLSTALDEIYNNSVWCATFQLVWNDMLEEIALNGTVDGSNLDIVENLNQKSFIEDDISEDYYYKKYGLKSTKLKTEIESAIKKKFKETSDVLDLLDWSADAVNNAKDTEFSKYLFYVMLKREFEFENEFTILENGTFGETKYVKYFGINSETPDVVRNQVEVLYYNSEDSYAVALNSNDGDQVILARNTRRNFF